MSGTAPKTDRRRAALISSLVSIPIVVLLAFVFSAGRTGGRVPTRSSTSPSPGAVLAPLTLPPLPANPGADAGCTKFSASRPTSLDGRPPRVVRGSSAFVWAYGEPPIVIRCGVSRPPELTADSGQLIIDVGIGSRTAQWLPAANSNGRVFTAIDRPVYLQVTLPTSGDAGAVLPLLSDAVDRALPAVCQAVPNPYPTNPSRDLEKTFCTRRP